MDEKKYYTGLKRLLAAIVDGIVFLPLVLIDKLIYSSQSSDTNISMLFLWQTFLVFAPLIYSIVLHYKYGQTIGKSVVNVKVLDISEKRKLSLHQAIYRDIFYLLVAVIGLLYFGFLFIRADTPEFVLNNYIEFSDNSFFMWWGFIEIITMLTNSKRRAVHDFLAKSVVVRTETSS